LLQKASERQMKVVVGRQNIAGGQHGVSAGNVADIAAGLADQQYAGGDVPLLKPEFPKTIEATGRHIGEVERGRSEASHAAGRRHHRPERSQIRLVLAAVTKRNAGTDHRVAKRTARRDP